MIGGTDPEEACNHMALTDVAIRNTKPGAMAIKLANGGGMFRHVCSRVRKLEKSLE